MDVYADHCTVCIIICWRRVLDSVFLKICMFVCWLLYIIPPCLYLFDCVYVCLIAYQSICRAVCQWEVFLDSFNHYIRLYLNSKLSTYFYLIDPVFLNPLTEPRLQERSKDFCWRISSSTGADQNTQLYLCICNPSPSPVLYKQYWRNSCYCLLLPLTAVQNVREHWSCDVVAWHRPWTLGGGPWTLGGGPAWHRPWTLGGGSGETV